ncbi:MAG: purine-nucleoside phosphorylase [Saprospiraceae bacterium]|nr:purine-nucleoside phosphorylase [Saprospiraceae bacterium]
MSELFQQIDESVAFLKSKLGHIPETGIILGTGLGKLSDRVKKFKEISFNLIPHFAPPTVESHTGKIILAEWNDKQVLILSGRLHYYEGYSTQEITYPIRVLKEIGIRQLWITNASGSVNPDLHAGDAVFLRDHINFHPENPLRGHYEPRMGVRFPDMSEVYNKNLLSKAEQCCVKLGIPFRKVVYFGLQGPSLETPAEYRMIRILGADVVGMSTVPEVIVAHQCGLKILAVSLVTNSCPDDPDYDKTSLESVLRVVEQNASKIYDIIEAMLGEGACRPVGL